MMTKYRFFFKKNVPMRDIWETLILSAVGAEALHGRTVMRLDARFKLYKKERFCVIDATNDVGRDLARLFYGYIAQEFGEKAVEVR